MQAPPPGLEQVEALLEIAQLVDTDAARAGKLGQAGVRLDDDRTGTDRQVGDRETTQLGLRPYELRGADHAFAELRWWPGVGQLGELERELARQGLAVAIGQDRLNRQTASLLEQRDVGGQSGGRGAGVGVR